jgi:hypothetical protein
VIVPDEEEQLRRLTDPRFDPRETVLLSSPIPGGPSGMSAGVPGRVLRFVRETNTVHVTVETAEPAILFLSQTHYPGWRAFVDGRRRDILRADYALTAVLLPANSRDVVLTFSPWRLGRR